MADISAKAVAELRAKSGCGLMDCKRALQEAQGDFDEAMKLLRERGLAVAAKKADRIAAEGVVDILLSDDGKTAVMIEVNAETDFVAKNASFQEFVKGILKTILSVRPADIDALMASKYVGTDFTVEEELKDKIFAIGENMNIRRFLIVEGIMSTYIHGKGQTGVIVEFDADEAAASNEGFAEYAKNVALQVAAMPCIYLNKEAVPAAIIDEEKDILMKQIQNDPANEKKPANIIEKMVTGRIGKFYEANCLTEQAYVKEDSMSVAQYTEASAKSFGGKITIKNFYRYEKGEGLQKREENFAEEIANMVK